MGSDPLRFAELARRHTPPLAPHRRGGELGRRNRCAGNTQVYILGYPHLFSPHPAFFCSGIEASEARWITSKEDALNNEISQAVKRIRDPRLHYIDTSNAFRDGELCAKNHTQYVTGLVVDTHNWVYSFHPTAAGQQQLANTVKSAVLSGRL
ncbi:hypothetical protein [Amycolatopsis sp. NPDC051128]|uniref:hypothetical protein n=1 Tax=Amycolatopsis sp. NPDC051128 TaxID=3155412 RepID=UPI003431C961